MKRAPWVRFAIRISPKISEKPAESRNSSAPSARLFSVWMTQNCSLRLQVLRRREVARVHRVLEELLRLVGPELAHVRVSVDHAVYQAPVLALHLADVDVADDVAVLVEPDLAARGVHLEAAHRLHEGLLVLDPALDGVQRRLEHGGLDVGGGGVEAWVVLEFGAERGGELAVDRIVELGRVPARGDDAERFIAHVAQDRLVQRSHAAYRRHLAAQPVLVEPAQGAEARP